MKTLIVETKNNVMAHTHHFPAVSLIMPFNPKMSSKKVISNALRMASVTIENDLQEHFPEDMGNLVMQKLQSVLNNLDFSTHSTSIAVYVSPVFEKLLYLDFPVEQKIVVDESFDIRDLVYSKKETHEYLVLQLSTDECRIYLGSPGSLVRILSNKPQYARIEQPGTPLAPGLLTRGDITTEGYLCYNDKVLDVILGAYQLPLFVLGNTKITSYFKAVTKHAAAIINYQEGDYENAGTEQLHNVMQPLVADWRKVKVKQLLNQLEQAACRQQLATGMNNVWREAINRGGHLLVIEKDQLDNMEDGSARKVFEEAIKPYNSFSCNNGRLDEAIERVLESGGEVEFVDKDVLECYDHVALLK